jgi:hypothetical protein
MTASLTLQLTPTQVTQILRMLAKDDPAARTPQDQDTDGRIDEAAVDAPTIEFSVEGGAPIIRRWTPAQQFRQLLSGSTEKLVRFVLAHGPEFLNDELAKELEFDNPAYTSSVLGKVTKKLRRVGVRAEGHRHTNWYTTHRISGKTLLRIRPDVLALFSEALAESLQ